MCTVRELVNGMSTHGDSQRAPRGAGRVPFAGTRYYLSCHHACHEQLDSRSSETEALCCKVEAVVEDIYATMESSLSLRVRKKVADLIMMPGQSMAVFSSPPESLLSTCTRPSEILRRHLRGEINGISCSTVCHISRSSWLSRFN